MTNLPTKADLRRETRDWLKRGVLPAEAARYRRHLADVYKDTGTNISAVHLAYAAEWDRIAATQPEKVIAAYEAVLQYELACLANQTPGSDLAQYWQDRAAKTDAILIDLDPSRVQ